jgi:hypothetical protein
MSAAAGWTPVADTSAWKPVPEASNRTAPRLGLKGPDAAEKATSLENDDGFMGTITKDFAGVPAGVAHAVAHPVDTVVGAFHQLMSLPGDVLEDMKQGNWGKLAAKATELAIPALSTERGAAAAASVGNAAGTVKSGVVDAALAPGTRDIVGIVSPRLKNALGVADRVRNAVGGESVAPELEAAAQRVAGKSYSDLDASSQASVQAILRFEKNFANQAPATPVPSNFSVPTGPAVKPGPSLGEALRQEAGTPPAQGINPALPESAATRTPLRPPLASPAAPPAPALPNSSANNPAAAAIAERLNQALGLKPEPTTIPVTPKPGLTQEAIAGAARGNRSDAAAAIADEIMSGRSSLKLEEDNASVAAHDANLQGIAQKLGYDFPKTPAARAKWRQEIMDAVGKWTAGNNLGDTMK